MEYAKNKDSRDQLIKEHNEMIDTLVKRDSVEGLKIVEEHIRNQEKVILEKIEEDAANNQVKRR